MVDRPDVETPQGAKPTGTNGRRQHTPTPLRGGGIDTTANETCGNEHERPQAIDNETRVHRPVPEPSPRPARPRKRRGRYNRICGGHGLGETPGPIPNPEAKTQHGNGTALGRVWESSTPPLHNSQGAPHGTRRAGPLPHTPTHPPTTRPDPTEPPDTALTDTATTEPMPAPLRARPCGRRWKAPLASQAPPHPRSALFMNG